MVFNATFNNISVISWWSAGKNHQPAASPWQIITQRIAWVGFKFTTLVIKEGKYARKYLKLEKVIYCQWLYKARIIYSQMYFDCSNRSAAV